MKKTKPAAKPAPKKITAKLAPRVRSAKKKAARKAKMSTQLRYKARQAKREAWAAKNPDMIPGELGKPATPKVTDAQVVEAVAAAPFESQHEKLVEQAEEGVKVRTLTAQEIDESIDAFRAKVGEPLTAVAVTSQIGDRFDTSRDHLTGDQLDPDSPSYVPPGKSE